MSLHYLNQTPLIKSLYEKEKVDDRRGDMRQKVNLYSFTKLLTEQLSRLILEET